MMKFPVAHKLSWLAAATGLVLGVSGYNCDLWNQTDDRFYAFSSQADVDEAVGGCTTIIGNFYISANYSGPLVLSNATNITGGITTPATDPAGITSFIADNVLYIHELYLDNTPDLMYISMASLQNASTISVNTAGTVNFPNLTNASTLGLYGPVTSMNFDSLVGLDESLTAYPVDPLASDIGMGSEDYANWNWKQYPPMQIDLPALVNCTFIDIFGNISNISLPKLALSVQAPYSSLRGHSSGISISTFGNPLNLSLPELSNASNINLVGTIDRWSFPSLDAISGAFSYASYNPVPVNMAPLQRANEILLSGNMTAINISSVEYIGHILNIVDDLDINCNPLLSKWDTVDHADPIPTASDYVNEVTFICTVPDKGNKSLSTGATLGIVVGIGIPGVIGIFLLLRHRSNLRKKQMLEQRQWENNIRRLEGEEHELQTVLRDPEAGDEELPMYRPKPVGGSDDSSREEGHVPVDGPEPPQYVKEHEQHE